ncbi:MAG: cobalamin-dependent protein, partial [Anaerolineae bacterium]|nr:cobalamin-dependent protein [Anaerolineae bacterium]
MRVLLASPESEVWNSRKHVHMGLGYLAGSLRAHGYECEIWDASVEEDVESFDQKLARDPFDIVCLSAPTPLIVNAWESAKTAKKHGAITILGGPHLTLMPHESMEKDQVDLVVRGEAEYTIVEIMQAFEKQAEINRARNQSPITPHHFDSEAGWGHIMGLSWRNEAGKIMHNLDRPLPDDIDALPFPAFDMFKIDRYTNLNPLTEGLDMNARAFTIVTSRGCPYKCTY